MTIATASPARPEHYGPAPFSFLSSVPFVVAFEFDADLAIDALKIPLV